MKISEITVREANLIDLYLNAKETSKQFAEAVQFAAMQADASPAVVRRYIKALATEKANAVANETEQLVLLFQSMPTVTATAEAA